MDEDIGERMGVFENVGKALEGAGKTLQGFHNCFICGRGIKKDHDLCAACYARNKPFMSKEWFE